MLQVPSLCALSVLPVKSIRWRCSAGQRLQSLKSFVQPSPARPEDRSLLDRVSQSQTGGIGLQADAIVFRQIKITDGSVNYLVRQPNPSWRIDQRFGDLR